MIQCAFCSECQRERGEDGAVLAPLDTEDGTQQWRCTAGTGCRLEAEEAAKAPHGARMTFDDPTHRPLRVDELCSCHLCAVVPAALERHRATLGRDYYPREVVELTVRVMVEARGNESRQVDLFGGAP